MHTADVCSRQLILGALSIGPRVCERHSALRACLRNAMYRLTVNETAHHVTLLVNYSISANDRLRYTCNTL